MPIEQFLRIALAPAARKRPGQHFSNQLSMHRYDLFQGLQEAGLDPYYKNDLIWAAIEWLKENWEEK